MLGDGVPIREGVIGEDGRILQAYAKVDPKTHLGQVLSDLAAS